MNEMRLKYQLSEIEAIYTKISIDVATSMTSIQIHKCESLFFFVTPT